MSSKGMVRIEGQLLEVILMLQNSVLVVSPATALESPLFVLCLDGLSVRPIYEDDNFFGIEVNHKDGYYQANSIYFESVAILSQWLSVLNIYSEDSIQNRYEAKEVIGRGKCSTIRRCVCLKDHKEYALKEI